MGDDRQNRPYRRVGDAAKCPACGWGMDPEAYRCPKCFIYFCFKCRVRVTEREPQFQCADQSCPCYGKLLCAACTVMVPEFKDVTQTEYDYVLDTLERTVEVGDNWGYAALIVPLLVGVTVCAYLSRGFTDWDESSFTQWNKSILGAGIVAAVGAFILVAILLHNAGSTWFKQVKVVPATTKGVPRQVTENKQVAEHRCCIQCRHPIKALR
ncbi:MAG TPA: hypothetical protein VEL76_06540 [Gemmataceae bacterium]|nr:hypothetical protein [Gemmataceae bacterium]